MICLSLHRKCTCPQCERVRQWNRDASKERTRLDAEAILERRLARYSPQSTFGGMSYGFVRSRGGKQAAE